MAPFALVQEMLFPERKIRPAPTPAHENLLMNDTIHPPLNARASGEGASMA
jgi:hypothetical protein